MADETGTQWATCHKEVAEKILDQSTSKLVNMLLYEDEKVLSEVIEDRIFTSWRVEVEASQGRFHTIVDVDKISYCDLIKQYKNTIKEEGLELTTDIE